MARFSSSRSILTNSTSALSLPFRTSAATWAFSSFRMIAGPSFSSRAKCFSRVAHRSQGKWRHRAVPCHAISHATPGVPNGHHRRVGAPRTLELVRFRPDRSGLGVLAAALWARFPAFRNDRQVSHGSFALLATLSLALSVLLTPQASPQETVDWSKRAQECRATIHVSLKVENQTTQLWDEIQTFATCRPAAKPSSRFQYAPSARTDCA